MKRLLFASLILSSLYVAGQPGNTPGIVVNNNGDTLVGDINYREWTKNPSKIDFIEKNGRKQTFEAGSIRSFFVEKTKERYESYEVDIDLALHNSNTVIESRISNPGIEHKKAFLLQLINNKLLSLYAYTDNNKKHVYISTSNGNPVELINQYLFEEVGNMIRKNEAFREQLKTVFADCPEIALKTRDLPYLEKPIKKLIVQYLECALPGTVIESRKDRMVQVDFGVIAGVMYNSYSFTGNGYLTKNDFSSNISPVIGASVDVGFKVNNNKWYIINELVYKQYKTSASLFTHTILYDYTEYVDFSFAYLQVNTLLRYSFSAGGSVKPYLNAGIANAFKVAAGKNTSRTTYTDGRNDKVAKGLEDASWYERSMIFGAGITIRRIQLEARYGLGNGFSPYVNTKSKVNSPQFIIAYKF